MKHKLMPTTMKTLLIISLLFVTASMAAQYDTLRYVGGVPQYDYQKLSKKIAGLENNLELYAAQRQQAFFWFGGSIITSVAASAYNISVEPMPVLHVIPITMSIVGVVKLLGAEKYLRRVEVMGSGVRVKF